LNIESSADVWFLACRNIVPPLKGMSNAELEKAANQVLVPLDGNYTTLYDNVLAEDHFKHVIIGTWVFFLH
jgi:hypothetical protein